MGGSAVLPVLLYDFEDFPKEDMLEVLLLSTEFIAWMDVWPGCWSIDAGANLLFATTSVALPGWDGLTLMAGELPAAEHIKLKIINNTMYTY